MQGRPALGLAAVSPPTEKTSPLFFPLLLFYKSKNTMQRTIEQVQQASGTFWTCHNKQTQNLGLLPTSTMPKLTEFHPSEAATPPGECSTSSALKGTT